METENPLSIRLKFEPKNKEGNDYNLAKKENKCVVCGSDSDFSRCYIVPHAYRKHFDYHYKINSPHDIGIHDNKN